MKHGHDFEDIDKAALTQALLALGACPKCRRRLRTAHSDRSLYACVTCDESWPKLESLPEIHFCCGESCPGLPWKASDRPHPAECSKLRHRRPSGKVRENTEIHGEVPQGDATTKTEPRGRIMP